MNMKTSIEKQWTRHYWLDSSFLIAIAALIGVGTGFAAIGFKMLIGLSHTLFFSGGGSLLGSFLGRYYVILIPALGGLVVGPLVYFLAREAKGHGVPEVMAAVAEKDGILRPRLVLVKAFASAITIGSGGSAGREGPIVQISSAIGSTVGQLLRVQPDIMKTLVACGAAGGISATFNAPIGGVLFAQELILGRFTSKNFILIVITSVFSAIISRVYWGDTPAFKVEPYTLVSPQELGFYLVLGILAGLFAVLYIKTLYKTEDIFDRLHRVPEYFRPVIGGLLVGCIGLYFPQVFGVGYETIEEVLSNNLSWLLVFILLFAKLIATSLSIGSGGSGGVFAPGLFMGSMLGGSFGFLVDKLFPYITAPPGAYALVGMAGVFAGTSQAPITAIIIIFEMTGDYKVVLPLMIVCVISALVARGIWPETIYTQKLARRGLHLRAGNNVDLMASMPVEAVMTANVKTLDVNMPLAEAKEIMLKMSYTGYPVVDGDKMVGVVTYEQVLRALREDSKRQILNDIMGEEIISVHPRETIGTVMAKMAEGDVGRLPVVDPEDSSRLLGIISRSDIIDAYSLAAKRDGGTTT